MFNYRKMFSNLVAKLKDNKGMATLVADVATLLAAGGVSTIAGGRVNARPKIDSDSLTIAGSETSGSTIDVGRHVPKGSRMVALIIHVSAAQSSLTIDIGDDESTTRYASADTSLQAAGTYVFSLQNYLVDLTVASTPDDQIVITTGGATMTAGQLEFVVISTID